MSELRIQDPRLFSAWHAWAERAVQLLTNNWDSVDPDDLYEGVWEWQPSSRPGNPWWGRRTTRRPWLWPLIEELENPLHAFPEYERTVTVLKENPVIGPQVGSHVGHILSSHLLREDELVEGILQEMALRMSELAWDEKAFQESYTHIETALYAESFQYKLVAPIFQVKFDRLPLHLGEGLQIAEMSLKELNAVVASGLMARDLRTDEYKHVFRSPVAVVHDYELPKRVTPQGSDDEDDKPDDPAEHREVMRLFAMTETVVDDVMRTLRLVHRGAFSVPGAIHLPLTWFEEEEQPRLDFLHTGSQFSLMNARFNQGNCDEIEEFHRWLHESRVERHQGLMQAARRFSYAMERHRPEDQILDAMIAAEALFLSEVGGASDKGELKYRLSMRAAFFLGKDSEERSTIFRFMKRAYDARSAIAHGGEPADLRDAKGAKIDSELFARYLAHYVRRAIRKAIREMPSSGPLADWEGLILGQS